MCEIPLDSENLWQIIASNGGKEMLQVTKKNALLHILLWPQSGQMFIAHVSEERSLAPEERNVLLTKPNISLLGSFKVPLDQVL
jgi:hypothetical protein